MSSEKVSDDRIRNTRAWAFVRIGTLSGAEVIVAACDECLASRAQAERDARAHAMLLKICEMDDKPEIFAYDFEFSAWHWRLPEDESGSSYGTDGNRPTSATDFYLAVEALGKRYGLCSSAIDAAIAKGEAK